MSNNSFFSPSEKENNRKLSISSNRFSMSNKDFIKPAPLKETQSKSKFNSIVKLDYLKKCLSSKKFDKNIPIFTFTKTDSKIRKKKKEFKKVSDDDLPSIIEIVMDDFDKKTFNQISLFESPKISELISSISKDEITENDFEVYTWISYILYNQKDIDNTIKNSIIEVFPLELINKSIDNSDRGVLNMMFNCLICLIQNEINYNILKTKNIRKFILILLDILKSTKHYRIKRKIVALISLIFKFDNKILTEFFCKFHNIIDEINLGSIILIKLYQDMKKKLSLIFHKLYEKIDTKDKKEIEEILENLDVCIQLMSISESQLIFHYDSYKSFIIKIKSCVPQVLIMQKIKVLKRRINRIFN